MSPRHVNGWGDVTDFCDGGGPAMFSLNAPHFGVRHLDDRHLALWFPDLLSVALGCGTFASITVATSSSLSSTMASRTARADASGLGTVIYFSLTFNTSVLGFLVDCFRQLAAVISESAICVIRWLWDFSRRPSRERRGNCYSVVHQFTSRSQ